MAAVFVVLLSKYLIMLRYVLRLIAVHRQGHLWMTRIIHLNQQQHPWQCCRIGFIHSNTLVTHTVSDSLQKKTIIINSEINYDFVSAEM